LARQDVSRYIPGRIVQAALVLWGAYTIAYVILYLLPGDTLAIMLSASGVEMDTLSPEQIAAARQHYDLAGGPIAQYFRLLSNALHGDLGTSLATRRPVADMLAERLPHTVALASCAIGLSIVFGGSFAYLAAWLRWQPLRDFLRRLPAVGLSVPVFWTGLLLIQVFAFTLDWFPSTGDGGLDALVLPAITLSIPSASVYAQVLLRGFDVVWQEPWIVTARGKGLSRAVIQWRHVVRNAALPTLTLLGLEVGHTVSGAVLVETVFTRPGIGRLAQEAVLRQDIPVVLAIVAVSAAAFVVVNLIVDLLYPLFDPRIALVSKVT
jgi:peptide/nickel transport system permease protein